MTDLKEDGSRPVGGPSSTPLRHPAAILRKHGLRPKKDWGQNFLADASTLDRIAAAAELQPGERVVELGAGLGHLTRALAATGAAVTAVERDRDMVRVLEKELHDLPNVRILPADAARLDFAALGNELVVVGNLPYNISTPILFHLLDQRAHLSRSVLMFQREVAERLSAPPGGRDYGVPSVLVQMWADATLLFTVPAGAFLPPPEVESAVILLRWRETPRAPVSDPHAFTRLVKAAFSQRRKTLSNSLKGIVERPAFAQAGIDPMRRAETLSVEEFAALERASRPPVDR